MMSAELAAADGGLEAIRAGQPVETYGLRQDWTVLACTVLTGPDAENPMALLLAVREHQVHPFVIEVVYVSRGVLVAYMGTYHPTLIEATAHYLERGGRLQVVGS